MSELVEQMTEENVHKLYVAKRYTEIEAARKSGKLAQILGQEIPTAGIPAGTSWNQDQLRAAFKAKDYEGIQAARDRGDLNDLLGITD